MADEKGPSETSSGPPQAGVGTFKVAAGPMGQSSITVLPDNNGEYVTLNIHGDVLWPITGIKMEPKKKPPMFDKQKIANTLMFWNRTEREKIAELSRELELAKLNAETWQMKYTSAEAKAQRLPQQFLEDITFLKAFKHTVPFQIFSRAGAASGSTAVAIAKAIEDYGFLKEELLLCVQNNDGGVWSFEDFAKIMRILPVPHTNERTSQRIAQGIDFCFRAAYERWQSLPYPEARYRIPFQIGSQHNPNTFYAPHLAVRQINELFRPNEIPLPEISRAALNAYTL